MGPKWKQWTVLISWGRGQRCWHSRWWQTATAWLRTLVLRSTELDNGRQTLRWMCFVSNTWCNFPFSSGFFFSDSVKMKSRCTSSSSYNQLLVFLFCFLKHTTYGTGSGSPKSALRSSCLHSFCKRALFPLFIKNFKIQFKRFGSKPLVKFQTVILLQV